jgi:hypothetical protein
MTIKFDSILGLLREQDESEVSLLVDITYEELGELIDAETLTPGQYYQITDFATVHWMVDSDESYILDGEEEKIIHTGETEPLIVLATSANTLSTEVYSPTYPNDIIRYDWNSDNWQNINAFYDGDISAVVTGWTGVIYRREDGLTGNKCNFDFREITYRLWNIEQEAWDGLTEYTAGDFVQVGTEIYWALDTSTEVEPGVTEGWEDYWRLLLDLGDGDGGMDNYVSFSPSEKYLGSIDTNIPIVDTEDYIDRAMFDEYCSNNQFDEYVEYLPYTVFGVYCYANTFSTDCSYNTFGAGCNANTFGAGCNANTFGAGDANTFGAGCNANTFGAYCYANTFSTDCSYNTFGAGCNANTFGAYCYANTFPILARYNELKNYVSDQDYTESTPIMDTNVTHQIGDNGSIYQTYISDSGTPVLVITTDSIAIYSD